MIVKQAVMEAHRLASAISRARGFIGDQESAYMFLEFDNVGRLYVVATDKTRLVIVNVQLEQGMEGGEAVVLHAHVLQQVNSFLQGAGARKVTVLAGEDFVGFSLGPQAKLMVERALGVPSLPWREKVVDRHRPGASVVFGADVVRSALAPFSGSFVFHLPEGDGQAAHLYHPDSDVEVWLMPMASSVHGVLNYKPPQEGGDPSKDAEPAPTPPAS